MRLEKKVKADVGRELWRSRGGRRLRRFLPKRWESDYERKNTCGGKKSQLLPDWRRGTNLQSQKGEREEKIPERSPQKAIEVRIQKKKRADPYKSRGGREKTLPSSLKKKVSGKRRLTKNRGGKFLAAEIRQKGKKTPQGRKEKASPKKKKRHV